jgi:hypothetical protein
MHFWNLILNHRNPNPNPNHPNHRNHRNPNHRNPNHRNPNHPNPNHPNPNHPNPNHPIPNHPNQLVYNVRMFYYDIDQEGTFSDSFLIFYYESYHPCMVEHDSDEMFGFVFALVFYRVIF